MKKFNIVYSIAFLVGISFLIFSKIGRDKTSVIFYGFAENKETEIAMDNDVEVEKIYVTSGQKVEKGAVLLDVYSPGVPLKISVIKYQITEVESRQKLWRLDFAFKIDQLRRELKEKTSILQSQIGQQQAKINENKQLINALQSIDVDNTVLNDDTLSPIAYKIKMLEEELAFTKKNNFLTLENLKKEEGMGIADFQSKLDNLNVELLYLEEKKENQKIIAPSKGLIGNVHFVEGEKVQPFRTLISFYEENPTQVIGYVHEESMVKIEINDSIAIYSSSRPEIEHVGIVRALGSRIVEIPQRIRKIKELKIFGREITIEIAPENNFLQKEKVVLSLKE